MMHPKHDNGRDSKEEREYYNWLADLYNYGCCLTGRTDAVQMAHVGDHRQGKGMGRKADFSTVLPLQHILHMEEESNRLQFWEMAIPGWSHIALAERLHDAHTQGDQSAAMLLLWEIRDAANRPYLEDIMRRVA